MIVFINGSFGVGKTTVAETLVRQLPHSLLFDAEEVGVMVRTIVGPVSWNDDFQDYPMWRQLTIEVAQRLKFAYGMDLIMPMTIWRQDYFDEVMNGLAEIDNEIHHFCLVAPAEVIRARVHQRGVQQDGDWIFDMIPKCVNAFESARFEHKIDATSLTPEEIVNYIVSKLRGVGSYGWQ